MRASIPMSRLKNSLLWCVGNSASDPPQYREFALARLAIRARFLCKYPCYQGIGRRDGFAPDYPLRHPLNCRRKFFSTAAAELDGCACPMHDQNWRRGCPILVLLWVFRSCYESENALIWLFRTHLQRSVGNRLRRNPGVEMLTIYNPVE